jgi:predicted DNA-binding protein (UPF0251 family)
MIPSSPPIENPSKAENRLFYRIRDGLTDAWTVLHSLGLGNHRTKPWTEVDFVLIGPLGVYCIEVKGGRLSRHEGEWLFIDGHGEVDAKREGPFEQAGGASAALYKYLYDKIPEVRTSVVSFGVATPDFSFRISGPDVISEVLYDERDATQSFGAYVTRLAAYWHGRLHGSASITPLPANICERIREQIRPDFDLEPSLRSQMGVVREELLRLTNEQYKVVDALVDNPRVMIRGGPGTGKSLLALREARRISREGARVLLCCFNRQLARHLASGLADCQSATVLHLHGFMAELVKEAGLSHRLPAAEPADLFDVFYPDLCVEILLEKGAGEYDALIIDEGQDLLKEAYIDVFEALLKGGIKSGLWRVFYDPNQDIYKGQQPKALQALDGAHPAQFRLFTNCRNTQPIAITTSLLAGTGCDETLVVAGPEVKKQWYSTPSQQIRQISNHINYLLGAGIRPDEITILSRRRLQNSALALGLRDVPVPIVDIGHVTTKQSDKCLRFSTVAGFKGLESEAIVLADIDDLTSDEAREILYVGTSRARVLLALFFSANVKGDYDLCAFRFGEKLASAAEPA